MADPVPRTRTIIVTGCSSGIGAHCARALKADGWRVFATVRKEADRAPLEADGIEALIMDYTDPASIAALADTVPGIRAVHDLPMPKGRGFLFEKVYPAFWQWRLTKQIRGAYTLIEFG